MSAATSFAPPAQPSWPRNPLSRAAPCAASSSNRRPHGRQTRGRTPPNHNLARIFHSWPQDPAAWFAFFDEDGTGHLEQQLLEKVLPAVVPVDASKLEAGTKINGILHAIKPY